MRPAPRPRPLPGFAGNGRRGGKSAGCDARPESKRLGCCRSELMREARCRLSPAKLSPWLSLQGLRMCFPSLIILPAVFENKAEQNRSMSDTSGGDKVFARARLAFSRVSGRSARNPVEESLSVSNTSGIQGAPWIGATIKPRGRSEPVHDRNQIAERIVPGTPFVAVEGLIVPSIEAAAQITPIGHRKAQLYVFGIQRKRDQTRTGEVLVLVKFYDKRR